MIVTEWRADGPGTPAQDFHCSPAYRSTVAAGCVCSAAEPCCVPCSCDGGGGSRCRCAGGGRHVHGQHDQRPDGGGDCAGSGQCSLRQAIAAASPGDTVSLPASTTPYAVTLGAIHVDQAITISGAAANTTTIDGSGNSDAGIFTIESLRRQRFWTSRSQAAMQGRAGRAGRLTSRAGTFSSRTTRCRTTPLLTVVRSS